ncbi:polysaccharide biosynthesis protein [Enterovibrio sp. ZSDZ42]|uniref:Polysaccharide biosynthesis protein n=1 Tax=Enterovibrio gelatinilyticus TaxID=2899819 RepID=A0ABT5QWR0_9GAMM|nr:nucleoside-diphosphate sugar epimerase/dehydratase [Enterovibrio sp. ZSDZ42]MDD1792375.1 polysaccharide biosynthesis protein [Enterovibrio sp. ZSDZ42]
MIHFEQIWSISRSKKLVLSVAFDVFFVIFAFYAAYWTRIGHIEMAYDRLDQYVLLGTILTTIFCFFQLGLYRAILRYLTFHALAVVATGTLFSTLSIALLSYYFGAAVPRSVPLIYGAYLCILCGGTRLVARVLVSQLSSKGGHRVLIYGAGSSGRQLALALRSSESSRVIGFIDEDKALINKVILGLKVNSPERIAKLIERYRISQVMLALPSETRSRRKEIIDSLVDLPVEVLTIPSIEDIMTGKAQIDEVKDVEIEDLLGRDPVPPKNCLMEANIKNKVVMVTGAGGSIGAELCRQILKAKPASLVLFELSEFALYSLEKELNQLITESDSKTTLIPLLGSVQRQNRLFNIMKSFSVQTVYHAAAYKHVPLVEFNVVEGVRNNVFGTYVTAKAAIDAGVESFVLISTDKAVRPTNVMGATKRMAELGLQALAEIEKEKDTGTRFCMVRFGNVLGSSGSVIPLFKKQINQGGPITVTHPDIIRYFMTIPEAAQLVVQAGAMGNGGDVFVLDMGEPVKIVDLAANLVNLSGLEVKNESNPNGDIEISFSGLRPGEKLYEELLIGDDVSRTEHERIMTANERFLTLGEYADILSRLDDACHKFNHEEIRRLLIEAPIDFNPTNGIEDLVWNKAKKEADKLVRA